MILAAAPIAISTHATSKPMPTIISAQEAAQRLIRRHDYVACVEAFIDCRRPGSMPKENYAMIGPGVTQNPNQVINLKEPHGFNVGAAAMPRGITNNLHIHFTAEVFICAAGEWLLRWGVGGRDGEAVLREGDIVCMPTWIFRGFTNIGPDDGWLFTCLGGDDTGGIIWAPDILAEAGSYGLWLTADNEIIDTGPGGAPPPVPLMKPFPAEELEALRRYTPADMEARVLRKADRDFAVATLDGHVPGCGVEWAPVIGNGLTQRRLHAPRVSDPQGFSIEWMRLSPGACTAPFRLAEKMVVVQMQGEAMTVELNEGADKVSLAMGGRDMMSVPGDVTRAFRNNSEQVVEAVVMIPGDQRKVPRFGADVVAAAHTAGWALDANGYLAKAGLMPRSALEAGARHAA